MYRKPNAMQAFYDSIVRTIVAYKYTTMKDQYDVVYEDLKLYAKKLNDMSSKAILRLVEHKALAFTKIRRGEIIPVLSRSMQNDTFTVFVNIEVIPIDDKGHPFDINEFYYTAYFGYIIGTFTYNHHIRPDDDLDQLIRPYYTSLMMSILSKVIPSTDKSLDLLEAIIKFNYYIRYFGLLPGDILKKHLTDKEANLVRTHVLEALPTYGQFIQSLPMITSTAFDNLTPEQVRHVLLSGLGTIGHLYVMVNIGTLLGYLITVPYLKIMKKPDAITESQSEKLEQVASKYYNKAKLYAITLVK